MIQPAAQPAASSPLLTLGVLPAGTEESANAADFATLLTAGASSGDETPSAEGAEGVSIALAAIRQVAGKSTGKMLPPILPSLPQSPEVTEAAAPKPETKPETGNQDESVVETDIAALTILTALIPTTPAAHPRTEAVVFAESSARAAALPATGPANPAAPKLTTEEDAIVAAKLAAIVESPTAVGSTATRRATEKANPQTAAASIPLTVDHAAPAVKGAVEAPAAPVTAQLVQAQAAQTKTENALASQTTGNRSKSADKTTAANSLAGPTASELQPVIVMREAQPMMQAAPLDAPAAKAIEPAAHDFAKLVDRLVEAREAAVPHVVQTAIHHAEFGRVSLRFEQNDAGLKVAMNSVDPDFARAVHAAQPAMQAQTNADSNQNASRQDNNQQQSSASSQSQQQQTQGQSQAQAHTSARGNQSGQGNQANESRQAAQAKRQNGNEDDAAQDRGGIYA